MSNNVILIGMPGCGKSTCGVLAAKAMCMSFVDTDLLIQEKERMKLQDIIDSKGLGYFENTEESCLSSLNYSNSIISTGGSAVYYEKAMQKLSSLGRIVYIKISFDEMMSRIQNITTRGIVLGEGESLEDMFRRREALYEKYADNVIVSDGLTVEQTVEKLCRMQSE